MTAFLPAILPVSLIVIIGIIAGRTLSLDTKTLSQLAIYILSPALIAGSLYRTTLSLESSLGIVSGYILTIISVYLIAAASTWIVKLPPQVGKSLIASSIFPNTGNLGLPLIAFSLGEAGLERAIICMIISSIIIFTIGPALLQGGAIATGFRLVLKLPLIWAMLAGIILRLLQIDLPFRLDDGIRMLGSAAIPLGLVLLGMQLSSTRFELSLYEACAAFMRLLGAPLCAYLIGQNLGLTGLDLQVLILQCAMPTAVNTVVLVTQFGGDAPRTARCVVVSTMLSFITLPLILSFLFSPLFQS